MKPRILLINPGSTHRAQHVIPNVGLGYVASAFRQQGWDVVYLDGFLDQEFLCDLEAFSRDNGPFSAIGIYLITQFIDLVRPVLEQLRRLCPDVPYLAGGPYASAVPEETLREFKELDSVLVGEVEGAFPQLGDFLLGSCPGTEVPGVWTRDESGQLVRGPQSVLVTPDTNPIPAWDLLRLDRYAYKSATPMQRHGRSAPVILTRGCPYSCTNCSAHRVAGRKVRVRSVDNILEELRLLRDVYGAGEIQIMDDALTSRRRFVSNLCEEIARSDLDLKFAAPNGLRIDSLDSDLVRKMEAAGFYHISIGIESGSQDRLDSLGKRLKLETIRERVQLIKRTSNLILSGHFILGLPHETLDEARSTIAFASSLPLARANFYSFVALPGSKLHEEAVQEGIVDRLNRSARDFDTCGTIHARYSRRRLRLLLLEAYLRFYLTPSRLASLAAEIRSPSQLIKLAKMGKVLLLDRKRVI